MIAAWRTVQELPPLEDHVVLRDPRQDVYLLTSQVRRLHDELRMMVEGIVRGDSGDWQTLAADALEELNHCEPCDTDLGAECLLREEVREALIVRLEAYEGVARAIAHLGSGAADASTRQPSATARRRTPPSLRDAMFDWDPMDMVLVPAGYESDDVYKLSRELFAACNRIFETLAAYQRGEEIGPSAGPEILETLDRCEELMQCDDVGAIDANLMARIRRYLATARRVGEEYARMGRAPDAEAENIPPERVAHEAPDRLQLPDVVRRAWQQLQELPSLDHHPELRDPGSPAYEVTVRLRRFRDELSVLVWSLERSESLDYPTRASDVLEALHRHQVRFERGVERDQFTGRSRAYYLPANVSSAVLATAGALGDVARALATIPGSAPADIHALVIGADHRRIPPSVRQAMRGWDPLDRGIVHADDYSANGTHELEHLLGRVVFLIMDTVCGITDWKPVKSSTGAEIIRLLDECNVLLDDAEVARRVAKRRSRLDRFLLASRTIAQEFARLSGDLA